MKNGLEQFEPQQNGEQNKTKSKFDYLELPYIIYHEKNGAIYDQFMNNFLKSKYYQSVSFPPDIYYG